MDTPAELVPARVRDDHDPSIEEIARPNIQVVPQDMLKIQMPPMVMNTAPFRMSELMSVSIPHVLCFLLLTMPPQYGALDFSQPWT